MGTIPNPLPSLAEGVVTRGEFEYHQRPKLVEPANAE